MCVAMRDGLLCRESTGAGEIGLGGGLFSDAS